MKIIASDYDGTLNNNGGVTDEKRAAIKKWREAGNLFGLVSGRGLRELPKILEENPFDYDFFVGYNGGIITDADGNILFEKKADGKLVRPVLKTFFEMGAHKAFVHSEDSYFIVPEKTEEYPDACLIEDLPQLEDFYQLTSIYPIAEKTKAAVIKLKEIYGDFINPLQNGRLIDLPPVGIDKAQGVYRLMEIFNVDYDGIITIGNDVNDYEMIVEFNSYAVENAKEEILSAAKNVTYDITSLIDTLLSE